VKITDRQLPWSRARRQRIEGAIIHAMGENIFAPQLVPAWEFLRDSPQFTGGALSAHCLIHPNGDITRCVPDDERAWHAGHSRFGTLDNLNETFLGAEFLLSGDWHYDPDFLREMGRGNLGYTDEQYEAGGELYAQWMREHGFDRSRIVSHSQVAGDDVRGEGKGKLDPGVGFNHGRLTMAIDRASH